MKLIKSILFSCIVLLSASRLNAQDGLVAHWSFDTIVADQFYDHVTNEVAGTIYRVESVPGKIGMALEFNGSNAYARIPADGEAPPSKFSKLEKGSISLWFRIDYIPVDYGIAPIFYYGRNTACNFYDAANEGLIFEVGHSPIHNGSRRLYFTTWANGCTFPSFCYDSWDPIIIGIWYHYVAVVGEDFNTGYLNGEEMVDRRYNFGDPTSHEFFSIARSHETLWLGRGYWNTDDMYFDGAIDEIRIFDYPLTQAEVDSLFEEGENPITSTPVTGSEDIDIFLYPNPAHETIHLDFSQQTNKALTFRIFDQVGKMVFQTSISGSDQSATIDLNGLPKGLYIYALEDESKILKTDKLLLK